MVRWPLQTLQPLQKTQLQPPFGPSVDSPCQPWFTTTNLSYRFPIFETSATALCGTTGMEHDVLKSFPHGCKLTGSLSLSLFLFLSRLSNLVDVLSWSFLTLYGIDHVHSYPSSIYIYIYMYIYIYICIYIYWCFTAIANAQSWHSARPWQHRGLENCKRLQDINCLRTFAD